MLNLKLGVGMNKRKMKREKCVMRVFIDGIRKQLKGMCDDKNNAHHNVGLLPDYCIPTGMQKFYGGGKVVIKDLYSQELFSESINSNLDIIEEQINYAIDEIYELKATPVQKVDTYGTFTNINNLQGKKR